MALMLFGGAVGFLIGGLAGAATGIIVVGFIFFLFLANLD